MLHFELLKGQGVLVLTPQVPLEKDDFVRLAQEVDVYFAEHGRLRGILVQAHSFPGWADFDAFLAHLKFLGEHEKKIDRVAVVTDNKLLENLPAIANLFVSPEVKHFPLNEEATALSWLEAA
jgi:hypothetical protein